MKCPYWKICPHYLPDGHTCNKDGGKGCGRFTEYKNQQTQGWKLGDLLKRFRKHQLLQEQWQWQEPSYYYLFEMQDKLIEHKQPLSGVMHLMIDHAGDIYRNMTAHAPPHLPYVYEKWERLERYMKKGYISRQEYIEEFKPQIESAEYKSKIDHYRANFEQLRVATLDVRDKPLKDCLLAALDMIEGLLRWYETNYGNIPSQQFDVLTEKLMHYFPEWRERETE